MDHLRSESSPAARSQQLSPRPALVGALVSIALAVGLGPFASWANHVDVRDANDTKGPLDIRVVRMRGADAPRWSITTWDEWRTVDVWDSGFIVINYDTFGDSHYDYYALVRSTGNRLAATLHRDFTTKQDERIRALKVMRPDRRSARITVPYSSMRFAEPGVFRWMANATWASPRCAEGACLDRAPDKGGIQEPRGPVPTPTITTTPTPSPTESDR